MIMIICGARERAFQHEKEILAKCCQLNSEKQDLQVQLEQAVQELNVSIALNTDMDFVTEDHRRNQTKTSYIRFLESEVIQSATFSPYSHFLYESPIDTLNLRFRT